MEAQTSGIAGSDGKQAALLQVATLEFKSAPFRAERFALAYLPAVPTVLDYGARSYTFSRSEEDPERFTHISWWESKKDFEQWWFSQGMQRIRQEIGGLHALPLFPHWGAVLERG
ncbi:MAG: antibiotic biosynthesis monooxygenase [Solirubrobacterales bacterium]